MAWRYSFKIKTETCPDFHPVHAGIPNESILESLRLFLHLHDMVGNIACTVGLYANDACFIEIVNNSPAIPAAKINSHLYITGL